MPQSEEGATGCIDGDTALDFVQGHLSVEAVGVVDAHLDRCDGCRMVVTEAVRSLRELKTAPMVDRGLSVTRFVTGAVLAQRYCIVRFIARGGMGEVYEAEDLLLHGRIALKTLASTICDDDRAIERLKFEANFARRVTHPNVCRIFDMGIHEQQSPQGRQAIFFITMELIPGVSLGHRLQAEGPMDVATAQPLAQAMVAALAAAHQAGVVHRDFKSDNVMLAPAPGETSPRVVVMDFGLARVADGLSSMRLSEDGGLVGTVAYMAPEQVRGQAVTPATDTYALGVVLFEMVTGQLPFTANSLIDAATKRLVEPAPAARDLVPTLPARWNTAIQRCLERDPARRFSRVEEVAAALAEVRPPRPAAQRRRPMLAAALTLAVALTVGVLATMVRHRPAEAPLSIPTTSPRLVESTPPSAAPIPARAAPAPEAKIQAAVVPDERRSRSARHGPSARTAVTVSRPSPERAAPATPSPVHADVAEESNTEVLVPPPAGEPTTVSPPVKTPPRRSRDPVDGLIIP